jgi:hypothetical protein
VLDRPIEVETPDGVRVLPLAEGGGFGRDKVDITSANFERAIAHAVHYESKGTQHELALTGIGEATIHPEFVDLVRIAREALPTNPITMSTNGLIFAQDERRDGLLCGEALIEAIRPYRLNIWVSLHRPEKAKIAVDRLGAAGLLWGKNASFVDDAFDWAGALDWSVSIPEQSVTCEYLRAGWCVVLADGNVTTCCLDAEGAGAIGHVDDAPGTWAVQPWEGKRQGCEGCHMVIP